MVAALAARLYQTRFMVAALAAWLYETRFMVAALAAWLYQTQCMAGKYIAPVPLWVLSSLEYGR